MKAEDKAREDYTSKLREEIAETITRYCNLPFKPLDDRAKRRRFLSELEFELNKDIDKMNSRIHDLIKYHNKKLAETRQSVIKEIADKDKVIEAIMNYNPYPEDIFTPLTHKDQVKINKILKDEGYIRDRISGDMGRLVIRNIQEIIRKDKEERNER